MLDVESDRESQEDAVDLRFTGERAEGPHRCAECGYGIAVYAALPRCPMCGGETWEPHLPRGT
jgi:rubrerythrin